MEFLQNKYTLVYLKIIERAKNRLIEGYLEKHHIVPTSLGGSDENNNVVPLTAREHFICHRLLTRMTEGLDRMKMSQAAWTMARTRIRKIKINSRTYSYLKEEASKVSSKRQKGVKRGPMSDEHKQRIREATIRRYQDPAARVKTGLAIKGRKVSEETRAKLSSIRKGKMPKNIPSMKGRQHSQETLTKMRSAWERRRLKDN